MKIGFVLDDSLDKSDGVQQYILTLGKWYGIQGHEVHYLVGETKRTDIPRVHSLSRNVQAHFNQNRMSTPLPASKQPIKTLLESEQFDILHVQMPYSPWLAGRIIRLAPESTAIIGTFHVIPFSGLEKLATKALGVALRRSLRRFDAIYSVSEPARQFAKRAFRVESEVLPNVVSIHNFRSGKPLRQYRDDKLTIVFLGRLVERKGCLYLLQALELLHRQHELARVRVLICGKGPLEPRLKKFVKDNHLKQIVQFKGFVSEEDKPHYLASADIAVFPSTGGESFGIVLIEAMAVGAGVVLAGNNIGYRSVMAGRRNQVFNPKNSQEFAKVLKHFINNYRARSSAKHWQEAHVEQFDVRVVGHELLTTYSMAIAKRS